MALKTNWVAMLEFVVDCAALAHYMPLHGPKAKGAIALTFQPTPPVEMAPLILAAHGLTWRERQVAQLVLDGCSNAEIGHRLGISSYTVQDHVKAVLEKVGVHAKQAFIAHLLGNPAPR